MVDLMYEVPSDLTVEKVIITGDFINGKGRAVVVTNPEKRQTKKRNLKSPPTRKRNESVS
jgi:ATP-dependent protease Clp ATPase subunit